MKKRSSKSLRYSFTVDRFNLSRFSNSGVAEKTSIVTYGVSPARCSATKQRRISVR